MAKTFLTNINLRGNQLLNAVIHSASTAPSALAAGQLYYNTGDSTFYYSTGTGTGNWSPVGVQYISTVGSNLSVTGGELDLGANVVITDSTQTLSNKTISGPLYFTDNVTVANEGEIVINSDNNNFEITAVTNDLVLGSNNGNIILSADSDIYKGSINSDNRIATIGDVNTDTYVKSVSSPLAVDGSGNLTVDLTAYLTTSDASSTYLTQSDASTTYATQSSLSFYLTTSDASSTYLTQSDASSNYLTQSTASSTYLTQSDASTTYQTTSGLDTAISGLGYITGTGQYIQSVGSNLSVSGTELDISGTPEFTSINLTSNGSGTNITVGDDAYIGDVNVSNNIGIKGQEDATKGGIVFGSAKTESISSDGTNLTLAADNDIILNPNGSAYIGSAVADNKVVKFSDLTAVQSGLSWKQAVNLLWNDPAATNTGSTGTLIIDGHPALTSTQNGYRILVTNTGSDSGIYDYNDDGTTWTLTRSADADTDEKLKGAAVFVEEGTVYGATAWVQQNHYVTAFADQNWVQFSGQGTYIGSNSILVDGNEISVILDSDSLEVTGSGLKVNYHTDGGLDNDSGLYVKTADGVHIDGSGNVAADYTAIESQLVTDGFVKSTDISNVTRKYTGTITGATDTAPYTFSHGLGTNDVIVRVYQTSSGADQWSDVEVDVKRSSDGNSVTIAFATDPVAGENYKVVIIG